MRMIIVSTLILVLPFISCVAPETKKEYVSKPKIIKNEKYNLQFSKLGNNWKRAVAGKFNIYAYKNNSVKAFIWIKATKFKKEPENTIQESAVSWINRMAEKYKWKNTKKIAENNTKIDNVDTYWQHFTYTGKKGGTIHEKIYRAYLNKIRYQFRLTCVGDSTYENIEPKFDDWIKTISFIR